MSEDDTDDRQKHDQSGPSTISLPARTPGRVDCSNIPRQDERFELLIFSDAGKPIYSYTKREDAVTLMPLCLALINFAKKAQKEPLQTIKTCDNLFIHFTNRHPLIIVVIHEIDSYVDHSMLVDQVEAQVISILTAKTLHSLFEDRPTFDLKRLLYGSEKLIDATTNLCAFPKRLNWPWIEAFLSVNTSGQQNIPGSSGSTKNQTISPALPLRPHRILIPLAIIPPVSRDSLHNMLHNVITSESKNMVFSLLFRFVDPQRANATDSLCELDSDELSMTASTGIGEEHLRQNDTTGSNNQSEYTDQEKETDSFELVTVCSHHERHKIKIADIHIILALLSGSRTQLKSAESLWMPICLPKFNQDSFVHSYIAYINDGKHCLVLVNIDRDEFSNCQKARTLIEDKLESVMRDPNQRIKFQYRPSPLVNPKLLNLQERIMSLKRGRFSNSSEITELEQEAQSLASKQELFHARQLQFLWYQTGKHVLWWLRSSQKSMNSVINYVTKKMLQSSLKHLWLKLADDTVVLGWHVPTFQLYAQFDGTITTDEATEVIQKITNWIKKEEDNFSIKDYR